MVARLLTGRVAAFGACCFLVFTGCMTPPEGTPGTQLTQGAVSITVDDVSVRYLDLEGPQGGVQTDGPLLLVRLTVSNSDPAAAQRYDVAFASSQATQAEAALLFTDPGPEAPPTAGVPVKRVLLGSLRYLDDPTTETQFVPAGASIEDVLLYELPPEGTTGLVLSLPPTAFGTEAKMPAYVRIPWSAPTDVQPPAPIAAGETYTGDTFTFRIDGTSVTWPRLVSATDGTEGFSENPLLRVDFTVTNTSEATIEYIPTAASNRFHPPILTTRNGVQVARATFASGINAIDMRVQRKQLGAGETFSNFMLFERPAREATDLRLVIPGARFSSTGMVRIEVPFEWADPAEPSELNPDGAGSPSE